MSDEEYVYDEEEYGGNGDEEYVYEEEGPEEGPPDLKKTDSYPMTFKVPDGSYSILPYVEMIPMMKAMIVDVTSLLGVSYDSAQIMLTHFDWNKEQLMDRFFVIKEVASLLSVTDDRAVELLSYSKYKWNKDKLVQDYLSNRTEVLKSVSLSDVVPTQDKVPATISCHICLDNEVPYEESIGLCCNHNFHRCAVYLISEFRIF